MNQNLAKTNKEFCDKIKHIRDDIEKHFIALALGLYTIREKKLFEPNYETFGEFVDGEMKMSQGTASKLIKVYEVFVSQYKLPKKEVIKAGWTNLYTVLPVITDKAGAEEWLGQATELSRVDLEKLVKEKKTGVVQYDCKHKNTYLVKICQDCGERSRVYEAGEEEK